MNILYFLVNSVERIFYCCSSSLPQLQPIFTFARMSRRKAEDTSQQSSKTAKVVSDKAALRSSSETTAALHAGSPPSAASGEG